MEDVNGFEIEPESFTSLWLTQQTLKESNVLSILQKVHPVFLQNILQKPHVFVLRSSHRIDVGFILNTIAKGKEKANAIGLNPKSSLCKPSGWPFAVIVFLDSTGKHGDCHLNRNDLLLLKLHKERLAELEDVIYVVKKTRFSEQYDTDDLDGLSKEIQAKIQGHACNNITFSNVFLHDDKQIPVRIGHCLHYSTMHCLSKIVQTIEDKITKLHDEHMLLQKNRKRFVDYVSGKISNVGYTKRSKTINISMVLINTIIDSCNKSLKYFHLNLLHNIMKSSKRVIVKRFQEVCLRHCNDENMKDHFSTSKKGNRSKRRHVLKENCVHESTLSTPITMPLSTTKRRKDRTVQRCIRTMSEKLVAEFIQTVTAMVESKSMEFENCSSILQEECTNASDSNMVHKWKIIAERHKKVSGFGYINGVIGIYLKEDDENDKKIVFAYLENHLDTARFKFKIEHRRRSVTLFSRIEQGSRINKTKDSGQGPQNFGTLGMFLHDKNGTYFFTTCAHVIDHESNAYLPENNTKLGVSVLTCHPNDDQDNSTEKWIDFSLVKVLPDKEITCTFGLKTATGSFIKGDIFRGDVSEILNKRVYKWGATEPYLQRGKCRGFENNEKFLLLEIDTEQFAKPGDSGCIICVGDDVARGMTAFVLVGVCTDVDFGNKLTYAVYKVSDALEKIAEVGREVTPCLSPCTKAISIESRPQS